MENDSSGKAERENYETQNDCSTAFRNPAVLGSWMRKEAVTDKSTAASSSQEVTETPAAEESRRPHRPAQILQQSQPVHPHLLKALEMKEKKQTKNE